MHRDEAGQHMSGRDDGKAVLEHRMLQAQHALGLGCDRCRTVRAARVMLELWWGGTR